MNECYLGIAWFCFAEVKKIKNHYVFSCFFYNFSSEARDVLKLLLIFFGKLSLSVLMKCVLIKKSVLD